MERTKSDLVADRASIVEQLRGKDQRAAQDNLALKQQAVEEVIRPLQSSLTKAAAYLQTI